MRRRAFVYGYPIGHSLSPQIHNGAFRARGLDVDYAAREVSADELPGAVADLRAEGVLGANVTVPHKVAVFDLVDEVDDVARRVGAVNTVQNRAGRLWATNTDVPGFARSLRDADITVPGRSAVVLGAGGAARAIGYALLDAGARRLLLANRTVERAERLAADLGELFPAACLVTRPLDRLAMDDLDECELLVNTTTVGMGEERSPLEAELLPRGAAGADIVYQPARTLLLRDAETAGLRTLGGLPMLVHQAAVAWELWTGQEAPLGVMFEAAEAALAERQRREATA